MTPLTFQERSAEAFAHIVPLAQEGSVTGEISPQKAFATIIPQAQDSSFTAGRLNAGGHSISDGGKASHTKNHYKIKPSLSDFVCDVDLAARRSLSPDEYAYFKHVYFVEFMSIANMKDPLDLTPDGQDKFFTGFLDSLPLETRSGTIALDKTVREKVGAALVSRGIYPFSTYMNYSDQDYRKRFEQ